MAEFFSKDGCPQAGQGSTLGESLFPYLDHSTLSKKEKEIIECQLIDDTKKMINLFADTEDSLIESLESQKLRVSRIRNYAANFVRKIGPNDEELHVEILQKAKDLYDVFFALKRFKSFFHYEIVEKIVRKFGNDKDHQLMDEYISKFNEFCKRRVFEVPPNIFHDSDPMPGDKVFAVKLEEHDSLKDVVVARKKLAEILDIEIFALHLCSVSAGCLCLRFLVSAKVADKIFPLTEIQISALSDNQIRILNDPIEAKSAIKAEPR